MSSLSRRGFFTGVGAVAALSATACTADGGNKAQAATIDPTTVEFNGVHQAGIATPGQTTMNLVGFKLNDGVSAKDVVRLMKVWTADGRALCRGSNPLGSLEPEMADKVNQLTITCGWGAHVFDVLGAANRRPSWLGDLEKFKTDKLDPQWGQTDLVLQICSNDPLSAAYAMRHLVRAGVSYAKVQWVQHGFMRSSQTKTDEKTPRNLFGQVDGTVNPHSDQEFDEVVWNADGPDWMHGGTSMVVRRVQMHLDRWEMLDRDSRERAIGRKLSNGAPLTGENEFDTPDFDATDQYGLKIIDPRSHMAIANPVSGTPEQRIRRRPYSYDMGTPRNGELTDSGLIFIAFQKDPVKQFSPIQRRLADKDILNEWITHIGSAVYWVPPGTKDDNSYWAQGLIETIDGLH